MTVAFESTRFDSTAFTRWCGEALYNRVIRQGAELLERACDLQLTHLYRQLDFGGLLAEPRTAHEISQALGFEASAWLALEAMLGRLAERTGVVASRNGASAPQFRAVAEPADPAPEFALVRRAMAELGPGYSAALEFLDFGCAKFVTALRDDLEFMDRVLSGRDPEQCALWFRATNADPMQDLHGRMGARAVADLFGGGAVLEIGGGTGNGIRHLFGELAARDALDRVQHYLFTDVSPRFILDTRREIRETYPGVPCDWRYLDINRPFAAQNVKPEGVDLIYAVNAAHVAKDLVGALRECYKALRPGGRVVFAERVRKHAGDMAPRELTLNLSRYHRTAAIRNPVYRPAHAYLVASHWPIVFEQAGFRAPELHPDLAVTRGAFPAHYAAVVTAVR